MFVHCHYSLCLLETVLYVETFLLPSKLSLVDPIHPLTILIYFLKSIAITHLRLMAVLLSKWAVVQELEHLNYKGGVVF